MRAVLGMVAAVSLLVGCMGDETSGGTSAAGERREVVEIKLLDEGFRPKEVWVPVGTIAVFVNAGSQTHAVQAAGGSWGSADLAPGDRFEVELSSVGDHPVLCPHHRSVRGMQATLHVIGG